MTQVLNSAVYTGIVRHRRFTPVHHSFVYPIYMLALDLDELSLLEANTRWFGVNRWAPLRFRRSDYFGAADQDLKSCVLERIAALGGPTDLDRVVIVCQVRCFGFYFSPVNFYFGYKQNQAVVMLAEVNNTPWGEQHTYLVDLLSPKRTDKVFHVSPFMDLDMSYHWDVEAPAEALSIHIENWREEKLFDATLKLKHQVFERSTLISTLKQWPLMTASIVRGIYWQALQLFRKSVPFISHPGR